jgi:hypothetical protein
VLAVACVGRALRRVSACLRGGRADLVAAPRPEGSRPAGRGMPPGRELALCPTLSAWLPALSLAASSRAPSMLSRFRVRTRLGPDGLACRRRALEAVEKVVTAREPAGEPAGYVTLGYVTRGYVS